ncbi:FCD domain-containing protein [Ancylobacter sp. 6x-1]|uniref:FCD domain-containing protein n=1 Tax=Ancylobacter crimeensis TaxID=2579147 RepID=A0ABT0D7E1_9HYPH|nr:FCD domain-containing protein [Ancylobacter crimeensis]MCK0195868.1 FCD domain-containing protein [Ancylobacter crimeensis]
MLAADRPTPEVSLVTQLRAYLAQANLPEDRRLPPERELAGLIGVSRAELRKALDVLEQEGEIWRHVGKGTFVGGRPLDTFADIGALARRSNPTEVMRARLAMEPELARSAAFMATPADIAEMRLCLARSRQAETWRQYEGWDTRLHRTVAEATHNALLLGLFDTLNAVRRAVTWGRLRVQPVKPAPDHHSFAEHERIVQAIEDRDVAGAATAMRTHLQTVERKLLARQDQPSEG